MLIVTSFFDFIYCDRRCGAPTDMGREFLSLDVDSLDAPRVIPAGSTKANVSSSDEPYHVTSFTYRAGF